MKSIISTFIIISMVMMAGCECTDCSDDPEYCIFGQDQTCNSDMLQSSLAGSCTEQNTCNCNPGYEVNPADGKCQLIDGPCIYGDDSLCNYDQDYSFNAGICTQLNTCECLSGFEVDDTSGLCMYPEEYIKCYAGEKLECGARYTSSTVGEANEWNGYSVSARAETGPEQVFVMEVGNYDMQPPDCRVVARLTDITTDLDLFVLNTCDPDDAEGFASTPLDIQSVESVAFFNNSLKLIAVDGYDGASGDFNIEIDCLCNGIEDFDDGEYVFTVDSQWNGETQISSSDDEIPEYDYEPITDGEINIISITDSWTALIIDENLYTGEIIPSDDGRLHYNLVSGAFAGGRFVIYGQNTQDGDITRAELTLYGSGVPIVSSVRGTFSRQ
ncbi:MAG: hypothetical protein JXR95_04690 [Deltaproteobacteria bacterium]|nr:hypothetical protein [Deltaproteobacteria bacterium]